VAVATAIILFVVVSIATSGAINDGGLEQAQAQTGTTTSNAITIIGTTSGEIIKIDVKSALLLQLPPSLTAKGGLKKLEALIHMLDSGFRYAIEFRNKSWFDRSVYRLLSENNICLACSQLNTNSH
jgi:hypothetical protein